MFKKQTIKKMKNILNMILAIGLVSSSFGQTSFVNFEETDILIDGVNVHVGASQLKGDLDDIRKQWIAFVKEEIGDKIKDEDGTLVLKETVINRVTDKRGDLLTYIYNRDENVSINVSYRLGYDVYLNSKQYPDEYSKMERFIRHFIYEYYAETLPKMIKENKKGLKTLNKEEKAANKAISKAEKSLKRIKRPSVKAKKA
jgi:hypothetical protein